MSRAFGNSYLNYLSRPTSLISASDPRPISVAAWWYPLNVGPAHASILNNNYSSSPRCYFSVQNVASNDVMRFYSAGYATNSSTITPTANAWNHLGWSWDSDDSLAYYFAGASAGTTTKAVGGTATTGAQIGTLDGAVSNFDIDGNAAEVAVWNVILNATEFAALAAGCSPWSIRPASLVSYVPIWGDASPEIDLVSATTWTIKGTLTKGTTNPPVVPFSQRLWRGTVPLIETASAASDIPDRLTQAVMHAATW